ncbi:D-cysteine desulfhydrase family protein [Haliangium sp.]|uniref:D-cysteine desulfhydrase family protein n=1 Tax=Haliangium sp. TaxID=2663208 RepID=UPI003D0C0EA3
MKNISYPEQLPLARLPTPLVPMPRSSEALGVELWLKRDDLSGLELSGNKVRKLEFLLAEARDQGADTLVTCGGEQSNHCRATALVAARLGMSATLLLRTEDPGRPPAVDGNILLDRLVGAEIVWIDHAAYARRGEHLERTAERLRAAGKRPYIIPEGGSNALGCWGYVAAAEELAADLAALPRAPTTILYACGSGGTGAGLLLGQRMFDLVDEGVRVSGVNVCNDRDYFVDTIGRLCAEFERRFEVGVEIGPGDIDIIDGYVGLGYARSQQDELRVLADLARREGIFLDPVYTGKAFYALTRELARDRKRFGERVVFVHTGGLFGLFPKAAEIAPLL